MKKALSPKATRIHVAIFGRTNTGKSSLLNYILGQDFAIVSSVPGTTTDVVEKAMELLPIGPVQIIDTAGINDSTELGEKRYRKTKQILRVFSSGLPKILKRKGF